MANEIQVPSVFQNRGMAKVFQGRVNLDDNLADGIGQSYPLIRYKGKIWTLQHRGERKIVTRPDDGSPSGHLDIVILGQNKNKSKSYYKKYDPDTSDGDRPICASIDGIVPDNDVQMKQSDTCALCTRQVWKTDPQTGRRGRECTDYKRLAVLVMPTQTEPLFGHPLLEPMFLRVPPDSLQSLAIMGDTMSKQGYHFSTYLTRITFDPVKAHPSMLFKPVKPLDDANGEVVLEVMQSPTIERIIGGDVVSSQGSMKTVDPVSAPSRAAASGFGAVTGTATTPARPQAAPKQPEPEEDEDDQLGLAFAPAPAPVAPAPVKKPRARPAAPVQQSAAPVAQNGNGHAGLDLPIMPSDTGAESSDDELDAEIAKLIAK